MKGEKLLNPHNKYVIIDENKKKGHVIYLIKAITICLLNDT